MSACQVPGLRALRSREGGGTGHMPCFEVALPPVHWHRKRTSVAVACGTRPLVCSIASSFFHTGLFSTDSLAFATWTRNDNTCERCQRKRMS